MQMPQPLPSSTQDPGHEPRAMGPRATEVREGAEPTDRAGEVRMWFAPRSSTSRYLDIVLARRNLLPAR
ncbi:hypothetical protein FGE12_07805 [Aggregicoccus sp. 17bor-14]|uniref:hypothetical protein n=1 Tax=Myxococcaceae TaxID=31 RepID=UPI00129C6A5A|nr:MULTISPECIES: hypothetical protein [Myxococcaceae]MBF5042300.1 hypothetical protein [Simulacricoccus sp. 17bor-14]MRI88074.1 hypothetical protein [Aggregicoccus sp. 17bor-14]